MLIRNRVIEAFTEAHRGNFAGLRPVALLLTRAQLAELDRVYFDPARGVPMYDGIPVIVAPDGIIYTPRFLMGPP
jgi:hypothetical protein